HALDVDLGALEEVRARLGEAGLSELETELLFGQELVRRDDVVHAHRIEDDAGTERHRERAEAAEKVPALPSRDGVNVRLERVELDAAAELDRAETRGLELDLDRHR